ncbi:helix-turn-helix domain-containing protein [Arthrobacter sp. Y-9]|uniref:winged helix-turn-helix transcriptional regulator n=1 Tax=Arthrobacter sp. Y-9 TaxID=3039385 RepID=UPI00241CFBC1|nr:helix-turn-helix domain-containing protein [Arthrobacter sp. Y-9]WFR85058.1 helix-turn-helix domain-containing protein [Arthrobacter sp. Y-9]
MRERTEKVVREWPAECAAEVAVVVLGGAWKPAILSLLHQEEAIRFGELGRRLGDPPPRVLTRQLRELEDDGLVLRTVYPQVPPKVEYSLTELGRGALPIIDQLARWGADYAGRIDVED